MPSKSMDSVLTSKKPIKKSMDAVMGIGGKVRSYKFKKTKSKKKSMDAVMGIRGPKKRGG
tara:strand:- start:166 stop:345 length:180 start_codon:yes stop_codon:yes gene_type:complete